MRRYVILSAALFLTGCNPPTNPATVVETASFIGNWYGIRPEGVTTFHSDSSFYENGEIVVRFFSCLSNRTESWWIDKGTWSYENDLLTITLVSGSDPEEEESYTHEYRVLQDDFDERVFRSTSSDYTFWLKRRWRPEPYDCTTTKADLDSDRAQALTDGRFRAEYPDYSGVKP